MCHTNPNFYIALTYLLPQNGRVFENSGIYTELIPIIFPLICKFLPIPNTKYNFDWCPRRTLLDVFIKKTICVSHNMTKWEQLSPSLFFSQLSAEQSKQWALISPLFSRNYGAESLSSTVQQSGVQLYSSTAVPQYSNTVVQWYISTVEQQYSNAEWGRAVHKNSANPRGQQTCF